MLWIAVEGIFASDKEDEGKLVVVKKQGPMLLWNSQRLEAVAKEDG